MRIEEATVQRPAIGMLRSLGRVGGMGRAVDLALAFLQEHEASAAKFDLLEDRLSSLCAADPDPAGSLLFELAWIRLAGFGPHLGGCIGCGERPSPGGSWALDFEHGGLVCAGCQRLNRRAIIPHQAASALGRLAEGELPEDAAIGPAGDALRRYIDHVVGRPLGDWAGSIGE